MKIISYNVNGIRSALEKGLAVWLKIEQPDVFCVQETKALPEQVDISDLESMGYYSYWFSAQKKGYSGVAIFSKIKADHVVNGIGIDLYDSEGRTLRADFGDITIVNSYFPSGTTVMCDKLLKKRI